MARTRRATYRDGMAAERALAARPAPTPLTFEQRFECTVEGLKYDVQYRQKELDTWKARFEKDPLYALEWSKEAFDNAARLFVAQQALVWLTSTESTATPSARLTTLMEQARDAALRAARWPASSTSQPSNEAERCKGAAWAELYESLRWVEKVETGA
jgi:hypothetical protein